MWALATRRGPTHQIEHDKHRAQFQSYQRKPHHDRPQPLHLPELGPTLDALADRRNVALAAVARTALAETFHLPDTISAGYRRGATPAPHTGATFQLGLSITPEIRAALADRAATAHTSRSEVAAHILADYLAAHPANTEPMAPKGPHATNPGLALRIPDTLALALDALVTYRGVSRAAVCRTALSQALGIPDTIPSSTRGRAARASRTGGVSVMLTVTPDMRDALDEMAETTGIRPYRLAVCLIDDYVTAHPITAEPTKSPSNKRTHPTPRVFHLPADLHRSLASAAQELGVPKATIVRAALRRHLGVAGADTVQPRRGGPAGKLPEGPGSVQVRLDPKIDTVLERVSGTMTATVHAALRAWLDNPVIETLPALDLGTDRRQRGVTLTDDAESLLAGWQADHPSHSIAAIIGHALAVAADMEQPPAALNGFGTHTVRTPGQPRSFQLPADIDQWLTHQKATHPGTTLKQIISDAVNALAKRPVT